MKYRLIKWYPSLPEGLEVGGVVERFNGQSYHPFGNPHKNAIYSKEVENNPEFWEKIQQPLFKTYDGIDIYEGDKFWLVTTCYDVRTSHGGNLLPSWVREKFSTKEKAKLWIKQNKPQYSRKNIIDMLNRCHHVDYIFDDLEYLYIKRADLIKQL